MNGADRQNYSEASEFMNMGCELYLKSQNKENVTDCSSYVEHNFFSSELGMIFASSIGPY